MARLALVRRICALAGVTWAMQACCCGGISLPPAGPPGSIGGRILSLSAVSPQALTVYAVDDNTLHLGGLARYTAIHLPSGSSRYVLAVPPGIYDVVARLDSDPLSAAGHTLNVGCSSSPPCQVETGDFNMATVWVNSQQDVSGIDIGDWGTYASKYVMWSIDTHGSPLVTGQLPPPSPRSLPVLGLPSATSISLTQDALSPSVGVLLKLPRDWTSVSSPTPDSFYGEVYFANQTVRSPLALNSRGVWLTIRTTIEAYCPNLDWRYATAMTSVRMQNGMWTFYFENPPPRDGPQPFAGYTVQGSAKVSGNCVEMVFTAATESARFTNLGTIASILEAARFIAPVT